MTTAVWFDLDGTLVEMTRPYGAVLRDVLAGHVDDPEPLVAAYDERFVERFLAAEPSPYRDAMADACEAVGVDADPERLVGSLRAAEVAATRVPDDVRPCLDRLADRPLGVITNGVPEVQRAKLDAHDLLGRFEAVVASCDLGAHKPDPAPFERARELVAADRHVVVGDDYEGDVEGAIAAGMTGVHLDRTGTGIDGSGDDDGTGNDEGNERDGGDAGGEHDEDASPTAPRITTLADLPALVDEA